MNSAAVAQGLSMGAIAAQLGIGKGSVHRALSPTVDAKRVLERAA